MLLDLNFSKGSFHISSVSHVSLSNTFIHMIAMLVKISFAIGDTRLPVSHNKSCQITSQISFFRINFKYITCSTIICVSGYAPEL
jgi:hypothetical protein